MSSNDDIYHAFSQLLAYTLFVSLALGLAGCAPALPEATPSPTLHLETVSTVNIPQKALWRNYVTVSVEAPPGKECELTYIPPSGEVHQMDTIANESGICEWKWKIEESEGKGFGRLIFTLDGKSETHFFEIRSSF